MWDQDDKKKQVPPLGGGPAPEAEDLTDQVPDISSELENADAATKPTEAPMTAEEFAKAIGEAMKRFQKRSQGGGSCGCFG